MGLVQRSPVVKLATGTSFPATLPKPTTAGNFLIGKFIGTASTTGMSVADDKSGGSSTWTDTEPSAGFKYASHWYVPNNAAGIQNVTLTTPTSTWGMFYVEEYDDILAASPFIDTIYDLLAAVTVATGMTPGTVNCSTYRTRAFVSFGSYSASYLFDGLQFPVVPDLGLVDPYGRLFGCFANDLDGDDCAHGAIYAPNGGIVTAVQKPIAAVSTPTIWGRISAFKMKADAARVEPAYRKASNRAPN